MCPGTCTHNTGVTPGWLQLQGSHLPSLPWGTWMLWWEKSPGCSKPFQCHGGHCPHPLSVPQTHCTGQWVVGGCVPMVSPRSPFTICIHQHPSVRAQHYFPIPILPWVCDLKPLQRGRTPILLPMEELLHPRCLWAGTKGMFKSKQGFGGEKASSSPAALENQLSTFEAPSLTL